jgi:hypothetical protein
VTDNDKVPSTVIGGLLASGFPFQTAIAALVGEIPGWNVVEEEFPWRDTNGTDQFMDVIAAHEQLVAVIECRKTQKDSFTFLYPSEGDSLRDVEKVLCVYTSQIQDSTLRLEVFWGDWKLDPVSPESMFCVVSTSAKGKDQRMLEPDAQRLLRATDAYAHEYRSRLKPQQPGVRDRLFIPLLVTNARLFTARYEPAQVSLESGRFDSLPVVEDAKWVRFRKTFTSEGGRDLGDRTIIVVNALSLGELLRSLRTIDDEPAGERRLVPQRQNR